MTPRFLGLGCSVIAAASLLGACSSDSTTATPASDAGAGGSSAGGSTSSTGGKGGASTGGKTGGSGGASSTGGASSGGAGAGGAGGGTTSDAGTGGTTSDASAGGADAGSGSGGATGNDAGGPSCTPPVDFSGAPVLTANQVDTDLPAATGGTIVDGLYYSTSRIRYTGPGGATGPIGNTEQRAILVSHGGTVFVDSQAAPGVTQAGTWTVLVSDGAPTTQIDEHLVCPLSTSVTFSYSATPTTITILNPGGNTHVFTKQ